MKNSKKKKIGKKVQIKKDDIRPLCPKCGFEISSYYFTSIKNEKGQKVSPKCKNCGYFDDPE